MGDETPTTEGRGRDVETDTRRRSTAGSVPERPSCSEFQEQLRGLSQWVRGTEPPGSGGERPERAERGRGAMWPTIIHWKPSQGKRRH